VLRSQPNESPGGTRERDLVIVVNGLCQPPGLTAVRVRMVVWGAAAQRIVESHILGGELVARPEASTGSKWKADVRGSPKPLAIAAMFSILPTIHLECRDRHVLQHQAGLIDDPVESMACRVFDPGRVLER